MFVDLLTWFVPLAIVATLLLQLTATRRVLREAGSTADQRRVQLWLVWLLPILGASLVLSVLADEAPTVQKEETRRHV